MMDTEMKNPSLLNSYAPAWNSRSVFDGSITIDMNNRDDEFKKHYGVKDSSSYIHIIIPSEESAKIHMNRVIETLSYLEDFNIETYYPNQIETLKKNIDSPTRDIIFLFESRNRYSDLKSFNHPVIELYTDSESEYKIFESHSLLSNSKFPIGNYHFVIPPGFEDETNSGKTGNVVVYSDTRFSNIIGDIALRLPDVKFELASENFQNAIAFLNFSPDYNISIIKVQLAGIPVISCNGGTAGEVIIEGKTGLFCNTLADYVTGIKLAADEFFNRKEISALAAVRFSNSVVARKFSHAIKSVFDLWDASTGGWMATHSNINLSEDVVNNKIKNAFTNIYDKNIWGCGSGVGSLPEATIHYREFLEKFLKENNIKSVVDFGCGDWQFSKLIDWSGIEYTGYDVVQSVIENNKANYQKENIRFKIFEDTIKSADLILCKDVLQHLPVFLVQKYLKMFVEKGTRVIVTNDISGCPNQDIKLGSFSTIDPRLPPYNYDAELLFTYTNPADHLFNCPKAVFKIK